MLRIIMLKRKWVILCTFLISVLLMVNLFLHKTIRTSTLPTLNKVIVVDAGHGGIDGGAVSRGGIYESHINLEIALKLRRLLEQSGAIVILTRDTDMGLYSDRGRIRDKKNEDLRNRKDLINSSEADILISIHLNAFPQTQYYGAQTFYPKDSEKSKKLAELIQEELLRVLNNDNHRVSKVKSDIYLMQETKLPTVLVECGFLSNPMEERLLQQPTYQEKVAWSVYIGVLRYFQEEDQAD